MLISHEPSDDAILRGWTYFREWRRSWNALLLFDALDQLNDAERLWSATHGSHAALRREWQVLRRCVMRALSRLRTPLLEAKSPRETERALHRGKKRGTLARGDQLNDLAIITALSEGPPAKAAALLRSWGMPRTEGYLRKRASELGFSRRKGRADGPQEPDSKFPQTGKQATKTTEISPGVTRYAGKRY
ncbi:hypothetical protein [Burkholderia savannae]|uniref:hypothetical protein n=1 Tax=Burkholderia savannae TaxID=1637837 RepID=UPI0012E3BEB2|nr:hypothetical protein [Burkholderia savannae]